MPTRARGRSGWRGACGRPATAKYPDNKASEDGASSHNTPRARKCAILGRDKQQAVRQRINPQRRPRPQAGGRRKRRKSCQTAPKRARRQHSQHARHASGTGHTGCRNLPYGRATGPVWHARCAAAAPQPRPHAATKAITAAGEEGFYGKISIHRSATAAMPPAHEAAPPAC